ncbi:hypothetical protein G7075_04315 [Phycicoccus sp. HDW14]|uniref:hypothetical protein n=1 Tax=Phycicoccus sp. HDW14 TaxID=2714941 RepID=UPI00140DB5FC|nr:hypothetical protein [Phycicoccus sp. HDW14]QIM19881.1 hypothetical protein G7075_00015 [Phycicoccus sp. HDW14]QIM20542.1 hypothetical protein G7075_04315 [Phycicoccus sp. HDW14]
MGLTYTANVPLCVRVKDKEKVVDKGDKIPDGVDQSVLDALQRSGLASVIGESAPPAPPQVTVPEALPAERDTREVWEAYAGVVGVDIAEFTAEKKPVLVAAVTKADEERAKARAKEQAEAAAAEAERLEAEKKKAAAGS